ncbi:AP-4 complex subunit beta-1, partial [Mortierella sp. GBA30]
SLSLVITSLKMDVAELAEAFKDQGAQTTSHAQLMQRVQELMGQGTDVSSLFAAIISSASTRDVTIKKIAYAFMVRYGHQNEELCFLGINTLHQDCTDMDPIVRSLAIRTLCSLGQRSVLRFMLQPLNTAFQDKNAYVRKTAAMACISLYELDPMFVLESEIVDRLYGLLRDRDTQVIVSAILALERILVDEGGIVINHAITAHLLQRYKDWNAAQLQVVLNVLCRYKPQTEDEIYEIMIPQEAFVTTVLNTSHPSSAAGEREEENTLNDPEVIKFEKLKLCARIIVLSDEAVQDSILDHLSQVASMKDVVQQQQSNRTKWHKDEMTMHVEVACRAIESIGIIGSGITKDDRQLSHPSDNGSLLSQSTSTPQEKCGQNDGRRIAAICLDRLFRMLVLFSDMDQVSEAQQADTKNKATKKTLESTNSWLNNNLSALELEETQLARLLTAALLAIEGCWQLKWDTKKQMGDPSGVLDAFHIKVLGLLLLRHMDQEELDRISKKKKPLRFRYDNDDDNNSSTSSVNQILSKTAQDLQHREGGGDISRLARISGIRMLLLEESSQQLVLRKQLQNIDDVEKSSPTPLIDSAPPSPPSCFSRDSEKKKSTIKAALEMRSQYAHLLQQQVQDLVQSIDYHQHSSRRGMTMAAASVSVDDESFLRTKAEQIAVLHLACHLVAFSIEHEDLLEQETTVIANLLHHRLDILAQAVDQLIPVEPVVALSSRLHHDQADEARDIILLLETGPVEEDNPPTEQTLGETKSASSDCISKDVVHRARMIETFILTPLLGSSTSPDSSADRPINRGVPSGFNSAYFQSEKYKQIAKQKIVALFGARGLPLSEQTKESRSRDTVGVSYLSDMDWSCQIGFNTLAVAR